jgi:transcriptional regulator with XRE-family HTH domain
MSKTEKKARRTSALEILHRRCVGDNGQRRASLRVNAQVAQAIYDLRKETGLTQKELAGSVGTTQSVTSRLEDADYEGHSLSMLDRIAKSLNQRMVVQLKTKHPSRGTRRYVFRKVVRGLRRKQRMQPVSGLDSVRSLKMMKEDPSSSKTTKAMRTWLRHAHPHHPS